MTDANVQILFDPDVQLGCRVSRWKPKMASYIYCLPNLTQVVDFQETLRGAVRLQKSLSQLAPRSQSALWVGTNGMAKGVIEKVKPRIGLLIVTDPWAGSTFGIGAGTHGLVRHIEELEAMEQIRRAVAKVSAIDDAGGTRALTKACRYIFAGLAEGCDGSYAGAMSRRGRITFPELHWNGPELDFHDAHDDVWERCCEPRRFIIGRRTAWNEVVGRMAAEVAGRGKIALFGYPGTGKSCLMSTLLHCVDNGFRHDVDPFVGAAVKPGRLFLHRSDDDSDTEASEFKLKLTTTYLHDCQDEEYSGANLRWRFLIDFHEHEDHWVGSKSQSAFIDGIGDKHKFVVRYLYDDNKIEATCCLRTKADLLEENLFRRMHDNTGIQALPQEQHETLNASSQLADGYRDIMDYRTFAVRSVAGARLAELNSYHRSMDKTSYPEFPGCGDRNKELGQQGLVPGSTRAEDDWAQLGLKILTCDEDHGDLCTPARKLVRHQRRSDQLVFVEAGASHRDLEIRDEQATADGALTGSPVTDNENRIALGGNPDGVRVFISYAHKDTDCVESLRKALLRRVLSWWHGDAEDPIQDSLEALWDKRTLEREQRINTISFSLCHNHDPCVRQEMARLVPEHEIERIEALSTHRATVVALKLAAELGAIGEVAVDRVHKLEHYLIGKEMPSTLGGQNGFGAWTRTKLSWLAAQAGSQRPGEILPLAFLVNRALTLPEECAQAHSGGLAQLGGLCEAIAKAWSFTQRWWILASSNDEIRLDLCETRADSLYSLVKAMASTLGYEVALEPDQSIRACLIKTKSIRRIYLDCSLDFSSRAFYVCHELAHEMLRHREANHKLITADAQQLAEHHKQEQEADALAEVMLHVMNGLIELWQPGMMDRQDPNTSSLVDRKLNIEWRASTA